MEELESVRKFGGWWICSLCWLRWWFHGCAKAHEIVHFKYGNLLYVSFFSIRNVKKRSFPTLLSKKEKSIAFLNHSQTNSVYKENREVGDQLTGRLQTSASPWAVGIDSKQGKRFKFLSADSLKLLNF